ncbi:hypothetical protein ACK3TF_002404 [Chlorella vulgaris]
MKEVHGAAARHQGWTLGLWLSVAILAHILVALFGVLNRWLQVKPSPPLPALRLSLLVSLLALASVLVLHASLLLLQVARDRWRLRHLRPGNAETGLANPGAAPPSPKRCPTDVDGSTTGLASPKSGSDATSLTLSPAGQPHLQRSDSTFLRQSGQPPPLRPDVQLKRGLSRRVRDLGTRSPRLVYHGALCITTVTFSVAFLCQVVAPGFVDAALVQLVQMFVVIGVALFQRLLLRHRLPWIIWPAATLMLGGAAMVIVPTIGRASGAGLDGWRGWLGIGLSVCSVVTTICYFVSLQAFRRLGFTSLQLQYCYLIFCIALLLPLTLPIDGADWSGQFEGWTASSWAVLHATWQLGAPTLSMFYGLRLVASIVESQLLLGYTVITDAVQIVGVVIVVMAVTAYLASQWRDSRRVTARAAEAEAQAAAAAALDIEAADGAEAQVARAAGAAEEGASQAHR